MKKIFSFLIALVVVTGLQAQNKPTQVQGIPYDYSHASAQAGVATSKPASARAAATSTADVNFQDIKIWAGSGQKSAALIVKWNDGLGNVESLIWGYRWDGTATGYDMIAAVAAKDPRITFLIQQTDKDYTGQYLGNAIAGIGYVHNKNITGRGPFTFDADGALSDSRISFGYLIKNEGLGQTGAPGSRENVVLQANLAIQQGTINGIIQHPFNAVQYGYPAYDFDHWTLSPIAPEQSWKAGWYNGYWSYYVKDNPTGSFGYSGLGASSRILVDGSVDGWSYCDFYGDCADMTGSYTPATN